MSSKMLEEACPRAECVGRQLSQDVDRYAELGRKLRSTNFNSAADRGARQLGPRRRLLRLPDHGAPGPIVASLPMSLLTLYKSPLVTRGTLAIAISQSGQSPDVVEPTATSATAGPPPWRWSTTPTSPLAQAAEWALPLHAGNRAQRGGDQELYRQPGGRRAAGGALAGTPNEAGLAALPEALAAGAQADWSAAIEVLAPARNIMVVGRGIGFPIALECALKLKETSSLQAEPSAAPRSSTVRWR